MVCGDCRLCSNPKKFLRLKYVDLEFWEPKKFNILSYLEDLGKKTEHHVEVHSCEIEETDFSSGVISLATEPELFKVQDGCDL